MRGGKPGFYPEIKGKGGPGGHFLLNLWDPFGFTTKRTASLRSKLSLSCERASAACGGTTTEQSAAPEPAGQKHTPWMRTPRAPQSPPKLASTVVLTVPWRVAPVAASANMASLGRGIS